MTRVGITGARGFVGQNLTSFLKNRQYNVITLWDEHIGSAQLQNNLLNNCDIVLNLAGKNKGDSLDIVDTNTLSFEKVLCACWLSKKSIINAGTKYKKEDVYKASKDAAKALCKVYSYIGLNSLTLNIPKLFGPHCKPHYNSFVTTLIYLASKGKLEEYKYLIKNTKEELELLHVEDLCYIFQDFIDNKFFGFNEYNFTKFDGLIQITFEEIIDILNGNKNHKYSNIFLNTLEWYKKNELSNT